ncbi:hypothetical protein F2Q70_00022416 [Brassica cretica]|uniref:Uncharacterized protein n=1 Tax=Brassica cretica TaxID=69181 RepID=A0A8S9GT74_BRACR|nr:hypothetical protein F2Q70_00022416 [Brassica cretica]
MFLSETKQKFDYMLGLKKSLGYDQLFMVESVGLSGGLAMLWKDSYQVDVLSSDIRIIDLKVTCGVLSSFFLTCVYGDPVQAKRFEDLVRLRWEGKARERNRTMDLIGRCRMKIMNWRKHSDLNSRDKITRLKSSLE